MDLIHGFPKRTSELHIFTFMQITAQELAHLLGGTIDGDPATTVNNLAKIEEAGPTDLSFIANPKYEHYATQTHAGILIVKDDLKPDGVVRSTLIRVKDPYGSFTKLLQLYHQQQQQNKQGVDELAFVHPSVQLPDDVYVGAFAYVAEGASIGKGSKIYPHVYVGDDVIIGEKTILYAGVKIYHKCIVGNQVIIHANTVVGSDGFGFAPGEDGAYTKIPQTGNVIIENDVEIGANTTIDRATMGSTIIRRGAKIDNLVQIAHNVEVGENSVIAAQAGVSGSTRLGRQVMVGGQVGFVGHIKIADGVRFQAQSGVGKTITEAGSAWAGSPAFNYQQNLKSQVIFRNLPEMEKRLRALEDKLADKAERPEK